MQSGRRDMRNLAAGASMLLLLGQPAPALACASTFMTEAVFFDHPPRAYAPGHIVLRVVGRGEGRAAGVIAVTLLDRGAVRRFGRAAWVRAGSLTSCTIWGRLRAPAFVVVRPVGRVGNRMRFAALTYHRSVWDRLWEILGFESYRAGSIVSDMPAPGT